jgi:hypothetical protein
VALGDCLDSRCAGVSSCEIQLLLRPRGARVRATEQEQTGGAGVSEVMGKFERIGWGPVRNEAHDLGTDLLVQARDSRRFDRGLIVGVQVKAGPTWFETEERDQDGAMVGWWYCESDAKHFDDWVTHGLPHLLILHDLEKDVPYWVHVTSDRVARTGKGCKILVPADQTVDREHLDDLLAVAARQKAAPIVEGSAFGASAGVTPPARRLRYALVAPRLVAPHPNLGFERPITPEEALALIAQGRLHDLLTFAERHAEVPDPEQDAPSGDWRWSFVRALWVWVTNDDITLLRVALDSAPDTFAQAASAVVLGCALLRQESHHEVIVVLDELIGRDQLGPVDQAWLLVQRARVRADIGEVAGARADAADAQRHLVADADDVTGSALAAAAAWQLFSTADLGEGKLDEVLTASDTAVSWWRSQTISWALMAEFYSANLASEIRKGMTQKAKMGGWPTRAPVGYLNVRDKTAGKEIAKVILDPERASLVREAFRLYSTGEYSILELQATMHAKGLTSPDARRAGAPISASKLAEMLANPFYAGVVEWGGVQYEGQHNLLVPRSLFDRVQEVLRAHDRVGVRQRRHDHYLKGLLFCGECGRRLSLTQAKGRYLYFYCLGQRGQARTGCRQPYILAGDAEALVEDVYGRVQLPSSWIELLTTELEAEIAERQAETAARRAALTKKLAKIADERQKLLQAFYANAIPLELLKSEQDRLTAEDRAAKQELDAAEADLGGWKDVLRTAIKLVGNCHAAYLKAGPSVRRRFNQAVLEAVYVKERTIARAEFSEVFAPLFSRPSSNKPLKVVPTGFEPVSPP